MSAAFAAGVLSAAAFAQTWAQPVREVEKPAKSAIQGSCYVSIASGENDNATDCTLYLLSGNLLPAIPEGKALVIEHASATCTIPTAAPFKALNLGSNSMRSNIPVITQGTNGAYNYMVGAQPMKIYVRAGQKGRAGMGYYFAYGASANCGVQFQGYLESLQ